MTALTNNELTDDVLEYVLAVVEDRYENRKSNAGEDDRIILALRELQKRRKASKEPVRYLNKFSGVCVTLEQQSNAADDVAVYIPLYTAPPAPVGNEFIPKNLDKALGVVGVALPESKEEFNFQIERWIQRLIDRVIRYADEFKEQPVPVVPEDISGIIERFQYQADHLSDWHHIDEHSCKVNRRDLVTALEFMNSCRAAMLQGVEPVSNHDELALYYLQGQKDGLEWAAQLAEANHPLTGNWLYDDPLELAKAIRKGPDMPGFAGSSPVTPDGWISCSERMPDREYVLAGDFSGTHYLASIPNVQVGIYADWFDDEKPCWDDGDGNDLHLKEVTHWMPLPEPPQQ